MKVITYPQKQEWQKILERPYIENSEIAGAVRTILNEVRSGGDKALKELTLRFDKLDLSSVKLPVEEVEMAETFLTHELKEAIKTAYHNIHFFHSKYSFEFPMVETMPGVKCWKKVNPIQKVGLYIPGGSAPLFSTVLMLGIPAAIAGCKEIILCTPGSKNGKVHPAVLFAAQLCGITSIYTIGGAQAIAAMAYGTETVPAVYKIFGPGNQYVTVAKQMVQGEGVAIDMPAGPSEVCVFSDDTANPEFLAADLLSQAEHGPDSQVILISTSAEMVRKAMTCISQQVEHLPRKAIALKALDNSKAIVVSDRETAIEMINIYAPEHLILNCEAANEMGESITNAGSVFLGALTPESAGDYASGTNHTLPTNGYARAYSGVGVDSFVKYTSYQEIDRNGFMSIAETIRLMAEAEGLGAHAEAVNIRMKTLKTL